MKGDDIGVIVLGIAVTTIISILLFLSCSSKAEMRMYVKSKSWDITIQDYYTETYYHCETKWNTIKYGETTREEPYQDCNWKTRDVVINTWRNNGEYPNPPQEPVHTIQYNKRIYAYYTIHFSHNGEIYYWNTNSVDYNDFKIEEIYFTKINHFNRLIHVSVIR